MWASSAVCLAVCVSTALATVSLVEEEHPAAHDVLINGEKTLENSSYEDLVAPKASTRNSLVPDSIGTTDTREEEVSWYLLGLKGNTTLVHQRMDQFILYLRIAVASLSNSTFDSVTVNSVSFSPGLLLNMSIRGEQNVFRLRELADRRDSLFILSHTTFTIESFTGRDEILVPRPVVDSLSPPREEETLLYLGVGAGLTLLVSGALLLSVLLLVAGKGRGRDNEPLINQSNSSGSISGRYQDPPKTIYSANFNQELCGEKERLHHFTPLDDSLSPITDTEVDFTPRYIREDHRSSWLSDISATVDINPEQGCNGVSHGYRPSLPTFSEVEVLRQDTSPHRDDTSIHREDTSTPLSHRSLAFWQDSPQSSLPCSPSPRPPVLRKKLPPRPPSRTDSLNPLNRVKARPMSCLPSTPHIHSPVPPRPHRRPLSVPAPCHRSLCPHGSPLSSPCPSGSPACTQVMGEQSTTPTPSPSPLTQQQLDMDVSQLLESLGVHN